MNFRSDDLLNPVMVKELRQDLRSRVFLNLFLWSQFFLASAVTIDVLLTDALESSSQFFVGTMWFILLGSLFVIFPGRAWNSFQRERRAESLELIMLTKLSAIRLLFGKWLSVFAQCALVVTALLPYLVLQYFVNRSDIVELLGLVYVTCMATAVILAVGICNSAMTRGKAAGSIFSIILIIIVVWVLGSAVSSRAIARSIGLSPTMSDAVLLLLYGPVTVFQLLLIGASSIAPVHENYAGAKRLTTLLVLALTWLLFTTGFGRPAMITTLSAIFIAPMLISSCFENVHPFLTRRLKVKKITPWLTFAGWPQGMLFTLLVSIIYIWLLTAADIVRPGNPIETAFLLFVGLVLPRALMLSFPRAFGRGFVSYAVIQLIVCIVPTLIGEAAPYNSPLKSFFSFSPLFVGLVELGGRTSSVAYAMTYFISIVVVVLLVRAGRDVYRTCSGGAG